MQDEIRALGVVNAAGTMTSLGAARAGPQVVAAVGAALGEFVVIDDLQRRAGAAIAAATGAEAGCVTASAAAGVTIAIAGAMTGADLARIEQLPDGAGMADEVVVQLGHICHYSAPIDQAIRLAGAAVVPVGTVNAARADQLAAKITERTAAMLYVVSHQTMQHGQVSLEAAAAICRARGVPLIADVAAEYDLRGFLARGADVAIYSAHKFLGGATAGIVAGTKPLVRAAYLQTHGIGRGMKVGKEGIAGVVAALGAWAGRDHAAVAAHEQAIVARWQRQLAGQAGLRLALSPDPTGNPIQRLRVHVDAAVTGITAWALADAMAAGEPPVIVRDEFLQHGCFELDPCNLRDDEAELVAARLVAVLADGGPGGTESYAERQQRGHAAMMRWPD